MPLGICGHQRGGLWREQQEPLPAVQLPTPPHAPRNEQRLGNQRVGSGQRALTGRCCGPCRSAASSSHPPSPTKSAPKIAVTQQSTGVGCGWLSAHHRVHLARRGQSAVLRHGREVSRQRRELRPPQRAGELQVLPRAAALRELVQGHWHRGSAGPPAWVVVAAVGGDGVLELLPAQRAAQQAPGQPALLRATRQLVPASDDRTRQQRRQSDR